MKAFSFRDNAFDIIRYWAAICVMFLHYTGYALKLSTDGSEVLRGLRSVVCFFPGVVILFALSGYLIAASFERSASKREFFKKRILRMYPELWGCTLVNLLVVSILVMPLLDKSILMWLATQIIGIANTPSCLTSFGTGSINGALWTIFTEVQLYIVLGMSYNFLKKLRIRGWIVFLVFLAIANLGCDLVSDAIGGAVAKIIERVFIPYAIWFFIGVFVYVKKERVVPMLNKYLWGLLILYVLFFKMGDSMPGYYANLFIGILLPLIVIGVAYSLPKIHIKCDLTYEIFLYHWIVLNVIIHFELLSKLPWYLTILLYTIVTLCVSWLSWRVLGGGRRRSLARK